MMRRRGWVLLGLLLILAGGGEALWWWTRPSTLPFDMAGVIVVGMTRSEVEELFGPPGDYARWNQQYSSRKLILPPGAVRHLTWRGDDGGFLVYLDRVDGVVEVVQLYGRPADPFPLDVLRRWFRF